jgi:hypothetical protein
VRRGAGTPAAAAEPAPALPRRSWLRQQAVWAAVAAAYLLIFPYFRALENPNENVRVYATRALAHHGTWALTQVISAWGNVTDTAAVGGVRYSSKAPGTSLLGVPVHFVHDRLALLVSGHSPSLAASIWALRVFTVIVPLLAFLWLFGRRVEAETGSALARDLLILGLGLGTMFYPYGLAFVGHAQSAALLFAGYLALVPAAGAPGPRRLLLAGALAGLSVVFEYQALLAAAVVAIFAVASLRGRALWFALGALGPALLLGIYHAVLFGHPWELPYAHLDDANYALYHHSQGFLGLGRPRARVLQAAFVSVDYGLFVYSPFLACGFAVALWSTIRRGTRQLALVLAVTCVMAVFLSGMANWRGGWCAAGPRYIAVVVPFLAYAVALSWKDVWGVKAWARAGLFALVLSSVVSCALSGLFPHFPVQLDNPLFDLVVPLMLKGFVPHSLGTALGLRGLAALVPWAAAIAVALAAVAVRFADRRRAAAAFGAACVLLMGIALYGRDTREDARVRTVIEGQWEPPVQ